MRGEVEPDQAVAGHAGEGLGQLVLSDPDLLGEVCPVHERAVWVLGQDAMEPDHEHV